MGRGVEVCWAFVAWGAASRGAARGLIPCRLSSSWAPAFLPTLDRIGITKFMDRKGILGIIVCAALFGGWEFYFFRKSQEAAAAAQVAEAAAAAEEAEHPKPALETPNAAVVVTPDSTSTPPLEAVTSEKTEQLATPAVEYDFTTVGGGLKRARLLDHFAEGEKHVVLNEFGSLAIGAVSEMAGVGGATTFVAKVDAAAGRISFEHTDERQVQLVKSFVLPKYEELKGKDRLREEYLLRMDLSFTNRGDKPVEVPTYWVHTGSSAPVHQKDQPLYTGYNFFRGSSNKLIGVTWFKASGFLMFKGSDHPVYPEKPETTSDVRWAGVTNQYFTTLLTPTVDEKAMSDMQIKQRGVGLWARRFEVSDAAWREAGHPAADVGDRAAVDGAIGMAGFQLSPGATEVRKFEIYAGPREYRRLRELGNYEAEIMDFGMFGLVSKTLLNSMNTLKQFLGNYAWAIVILTLVIKSLMWPLQNRATASMKKMQALQPLMTDLRERYKDDPQTMNMEVMKLYKQYGVNPFGGCLPMLVQIPIFFGFYNMLGKAVELRNAKFLWVHDLSQPDTILHLGGFPVNVLPLCMAVTMLWSMQLQPKSGDPVQQRMFMFVPLIFIFFCYNFASALALYWTVQNLFSIVQLYVTRNKTAPVLVKIPAPKSKR